MYVHSFVYIDILSHAKIMIATLGKFPSVTAVVELTATIISKSC